MRNSAQLLIYTYICMTYCRTGHGYLDIAFTITRPRSCLDKELVFLTIIQVTLKQCLEECSLKHMCKAVNYRRRYPLCELLEADDGDFTYNAISTGPCVFIRRSDIAVVPTLPDICSCLDGESCDLQQNTCRRKECSKFVLTKGDIFGNMNSIGSQVKFVCDAGYVDTSGEMYSTCDLNGNWTHVPHCEQDVPTCANNPCLNGATCAGQSPYTCTCVSGWMGTHCDEDIDECAPDPCKNGAACLNEFNQYTCTCLSGWKGTNCDEDVDECTPDPCKNGAACLNELDQYTCTCLSGWTGTNCDEDVDECAPDPCKNGAACLNELDQYTCTCQDRWTGTNCDEECYPDGGEYTGTLSVLASNKTCVAWTLIWYNKNKFPDSTVAAASNYCRDPDNSGKPWCCLSIGCGDTELIDYEYCNIPECSKSNKD